LSPGGAHLTFSSLRLNSKQQLAELFNCNHFIISQANPHAVMFASYSNFKSIWSNPLTGLVDAVLKFMKDQCRSWLTHFVELVGARRLAPQHATARGLGAQFFVQEYEGRACDISLIPWIGHRGVMSALMHALYNPSEAEFRSWVEAAQRETWKHIPEIKSHVAEEITLDRCVQRLRKRVITESWEKRRKVDSTSAKMGERVPSFFTSPSLVNFGGLAVADPATVEEDDRVSMAKQAMSPMRTQSPRIPSLEISQGWGGMGLRGNRSSASLERTASDASGLFIDAEDHGVEQVAGEQTNHDPQGPMAKKVSSNVSNASSTDEGKGYLKTTNMAHFYYRNFPTSHGSLDQMPMRSLSQSDRMQHVPEHKSQQKHTRRKSKSHTDIHKVFAPN
jgi:hypothetical protein